MRYQGLRGLATNGQWVKKNFYIFFIYIDLNDGVRIRRKCEQSAAETESMNGEQGAICLSRD